jgi:hypothetical protein
MCMLTSILRVEDANPQTAGCFVGGLHWHRAKQTNHARQFLYELQAVADVISYHIISENQRTLVQSPPSIPCRFESWPDWPWISPLLLGGVLRIDWITAANIFARLPLTTSK